jgi:hypothetical protein
MKIPLSVANGWISPMTAIFHFQTSPSGDDRYIVVDAKGPGLDLIYTIYIDSSD